MRRRAFTLIELLVVIAIIALLIAILVPSLRKARDQTKETVCLAHLKQVAISALMYGQDQNEWLPMQDGRKPVVSEPFDHSSSNWFPNWLEATWPYVGSHTEIYDCPSSKVIIDYGSTAVNKKVRVGYAANGAVTNFGGRWVRRTGEVCMLRDDVMVEGASILRPQWQPLTTTPTLTTRGWVGWMYLNSPSDPNGGKSGMLTDKPHRNGQNLAYVDGHVERRKQKQITSLQFGLLIGGNDTYEPRLNGYNQTARYGTIKK